LIKKRAQDDNRVKTFLKISNQFNFKDYFNFLNLYYKAKTSSRASSRARTKARTKASSRAKINRDA
jgi:hypothetical protein